MQTIGPSEGIAATGPRDVVPARGLELLLPLLCVVGLCAATYLSVMHYALLWGDLSLGAACGGGTWGGCDSVIASRYGRFLGIPVSVWGILFYLWAAALSVGIVMLRRSDAMPFAQALLASTGLALAVDAYLAWAMSWSLRRLCPLCVVTYGVNVCLFALALSFHGWRGTSRVEWHRLLTSVGTLFRPQEPEYYREVVKAQLLGWALGSCAIVLALALGLSRAVTRGEEARLEGLLAYLRTAPPFAVATDGRPARGPADARLTVVVFADFLCEQCRTASAYLRIVEANHHDSLRVVFRHFPADTECNVYAGAAGHPGACALARAAECARAQGRFWEFHDVLFGGAGRRDPSRIAEYAERAHLARGPFDACLQSGEADDPLRADMAAGHAVGVSATPTLYLNGRPVVGALKPWMLEAALQTVARLPQAPPGP